MDVVSFFKRAFDDDGWDDEPEGHFCSTCQEHHDSEDDVEKHSTSYTDWDRVYPHLGAVHRGMTVNLHPLDHQAVHGEPDARHAAHALHQALQSGSLGTHWTNNPHQAEHYAHVSAHHHDPYGRDDGSTQVVVHAQKPERHHIETDPWELGDSDVIGFENHEDAEVPLRHGSPVRATGLSWKRTGDKEWRRHTFDRPRELAV
jgi:hypothetical protein